MLLILRICVLRVLLSLPNFLGKMLFEQLRNFQTLIKLPVRFFIDEVLAMSIAAGAVLEAVDMDPEVMPKEALTRVEAVAEDRGARTDNPPSNSRGTPPVPA